MRETMLSAALGVYWCQGRSVQGKSGLEALMPAVGRFLNEEAALNSILVCMVRLNTSLVYKLRTGPVIPGLSHSSAVSRDLRSWGHTAFINVLC